jgi:response regulator RpfG family c-di-GMP phosphodiesterase
MRLLLVDDDAGLRELVRTTFELVDVEVTEADSAEAAWRALPERRPDVIVLDLGMPNTDGAELFRRLRSDRSTRSIPVVLLSGDPEAGKLATELGIDAFLPKPFSPLQLLAVAERLAGSPTAIPLLEAVPEGPDAQLMLYARDLRHLLELERGRRSLVETSCREAVGALASALETRSVGGRGHPDRVRRYALELTRLVEPELADDPSLEFGFLLHDAGMVGIPDSILRKPGPLEADEDAVLQAHPQLGAQLLSGMSLVRGSGLEVVRSHHERWDGTGYPDRLAATEIPLSARIFAVADALDAMLSGRPFRAAISWSDAAEEIHAESGRHFDPTVVTAFDEAATRLRALSLALTRLSA